MLKDSIKQDMINAMKAKEKETLATIRLLQAAIKQREVDERIELDDAGVLSVLNKMIKQRRDSIEQFTQAGRDELAAQEQSEIDILQHYLPAQLSEAEVAAAVDAAVQETGAADMKDMGKVMGILKPTLAGQADMGLVSKLVKTKLS